MHDGTCARKLGVRVLPSRQPASKSGYLQVSQVIHTYTAPSRPQRSLQLPRARRGQCLRLTHNGRENWTVPSPSKSSRSGSATNILALPEPSSSAKPDMATTQSLAFAARETDNERAPAATPLGPTHHQTSLSPAIRTEARKAARVLTHSRCTSLLACTVLRVMSAHLNP